MTVAAPEIVTGLAPLAAGYDGFILDLWGVLHDGRTPFPAAIATLTALKAAGKRSLLLSNAPRRTRLLVRQLAEMGIDDRLYDAILSSGEATHQALAARDRPFTAALGRRYFLMGPAGDDSAVAGLEYHPADIETADFILNVGPGDFETVETYRPALIRGGERHLPMICANPDRVVIHHGRRIPCAGALADLYADRGGAVDWQGKPHPAIYDRALALLGTDRSRTLCIGDSLATDIRGATAAGMDSVFVAGGIHAAELGYDPAGTAPLDRDRLAALFDAAGLRPVATLPVLSWDRTA
jgi:HAD superfamily hydrolase (TIGR01459 family)